MVCIDFHCLWRMADHVLPLWLRPADCGFMLAFNNPAVWPSIITVHADPGLPDTTDSPWARTVFATLAEQWNCLVAVGQVPLTSWVYCPNGERLSVADNPVLMKAGQGTVGAPGYVFGPDRRPLIERLREVDFRWALPPPPWATTPTPETPT
jgi:hypothetical protein